MGTQMTEVDRRISSYTKLRTESDKRFYKIPVLKILVLVIVADIALTSVGIPLGLMLNPFGDSMPFVSFITYSILVGIPMYEVLFFSDQKEDEYMSFLLEYLRRTNTNSDILSIIEERAIESSKSSSGRLQSAIVLIPAAVGIFAAISAAFITIQIQVPKAGISLFLFVACILVYNLSSELKRIKFDSALLIAVKIFKQDLNWNSLKNSSHNS